MIGVAHAAGAVMEADVLVVGAGIAGLSVAIAAAPRRVLLLCPAPPALDSSSALAQGGIAAPVGAGDSVAAHVADTLVAADHSADAVAARRIVGAAEEALRFLAACGVDLDRDPAGALRLHREAGHSFARVAHAAGDRSGAAIVDALWRRATGSAHVQVVHGLRAVTLLGVPGRSVAGVVAVDRAGRSTTLHARDTVLATGGVGRLFRHTTNGLASTGDGLAMALAFGVPVAALEYVQFHPTALRVDADPLPLLTEALRGAGARLVTTGGRSVMQGLHPLADLAPRDVVARAVWRSAEAGEDVRLDARDIFASVRAAEFPGAIATTRAFGLDAARDLLPVTAAAHYHMGGIAAEIDGRTEVPGLWACGEVACTGLHGANRLASNSLLEAVVCGLAAGTALRGQAPAQRAIVAAAARATEIVIPDERHPAWLRLRQRMWEVMGPLRDGPALATALLVTVAEGAALPATELVLGQRYGLAAAMLEAALARRESRGAHARRDFPARCVGGDAREPEGARPAAEFPSSRVGLERQTLG